MFPKIPKLSLLYDKLVEMIGYCSCYYFHIYGKRFYGTKDEACKKEICNVILMTYRNGFPALDSRNRVICDFGWGCQYRTVQMLLANVFRLLLKDDYFIHESITNEKQLVASFMDNCEAPFSIHQLVNACKLLSISIGTRLSHVASCQAMSLLLDKENYNLRVHLTTPEGVWNEGVEKLFDSVETENGPKVVLLVLSLEVERSTDDSDLKDLDRLMEFEQFSGMLCGIGHSALYVFGKMVDSDGRITSNRVLYQDPHSTRSYNPITEEFVKECYTQTMRSTYLSRMTNQFAISFLFKNKASFVSWRENVKHKTGKLFMFSNDQSICDSE